MACNFKTFQENSLLIFYLRGKSCNGKNKKNRRSFPSSHNLHVDDATSSAKSALTTLRQLIFLRAFTVQLSLAACMPHSSARRLPPSMKNGLPPIKNERMT